MVSMDYGTMDRIRFAQQGIGFLNVPAVQLFPDIGAADVPLLILFLDVYKRQVIIFAVKIDGEPIVVLEDNIKVFAWGTYFLVTTAILLGGVLTNESTGVTAFLNTILSPVFTNMSPFVFGVALLVIACFLTNICNSLVVGMILQPVIAAYCLQAGINSAPLVSIMGIFVLSCAIATPAASPFAALMFSNKQWLKTKHIYHYSVMFAGLELIVALLIGLPLANALIH